MKNRRYMLAVAIVMAIGAALLAGSISDTTEAKKNKLPEVTFQFSIAHADPQFATEMVALTLCAANIGSSGQDGVRTSCPEGSSPPADTSDYQIDSFFDVEYRTGQLFGDPDFDTLRLSTIDIEIVALQLRAVDPAVIIDRVRAALEAPVLNPDGTLRKLEGYVGHVTVLK